MARYHPIYEGLWEDAKLEHFSFEGRAFFAFLCSNKRCRASGIYRATDGQLAEDTTLPIVRVRRYLAALADSGRIVRDGAWLFVRGYFDRQRDRYGRLMTLVAEDLSECTSASIVKAFFNKYPLLLSRLGKVGYKLAPQHIPSTPTSETTSTSTPPLPQSASQPSEDKELGAYAHDAAPPVESAPSIREFLGYYQDQFTHRFRAQPNIQSGKDAKLVQGLLRRYGDDTLRRYLVAFLDSDDEFIQRSGYTLGVFSVCLNKVIVQTRPSRVPRLMPRTQANLAALQRFVENLQGGSA